MPNTNTHTNTNTPMHNAMQVALAKLSTMVSMYFPQALKDALLGYGTELDRLRDEVEKLRSIIEKE